LRAAANADNDPGTQRQTKAAAYMMRTRHCHRPKSWHSSPCTLLIASLAAGSLLVPFAPARGAPLADTVPGPIPQSELPTDHGSLTHSATKATTFKIATIVSNLAIFSYGTGGIVGGGILTAFNVSKSWGLFTANDYLWDKYFPADKNQDSGQAFDTKASFWRTSGKFLTYKPVDTAIKFASIYLYTGSAAVMLVYGTASSVVNTGVFYVNDFAWNLYDWSQAPASSRPDRGTMAAAESHRVIE
jgi:uncharacterized membrane protein